MAEEIVGFKIQINGQEKVVKSLAEMRQLIKEANFELLSAQKNFGEYSNEAVQAAKKVASLKDSLQEAGETAQLFDPGKKFQAFAGALSAAAGGISAFQGALGLLGSESENVQKTLVKVQSALALSQGLSTIADSAKDFQRLAAVIQSTTIYQKAYNFVLYGTTSAQKALQASTVATSTAMRVLRGVMASIGIGALIFGVTTLITKIMEWTDRASENEKALKKQAEATKILNQDIDNQISVLTALGGKEAEIAALRKEQINNNLNDLRKRLKSVGKLTEEEQAQYRKLATERNVIDIQEANRIKKQQEEETKKRQEENKKVVEDRKARNKEIQQADADLLEKSKQISDEIFLSEIQDEKMREEIRIATQFERDQAEIQRSIATEEAKEQALKVLREKYDLDRKLLADQRSVAEIDALTNKLFLEVQAEQEASDLKIQNSFDELDAITNNLLAQNEAERKAADAQKQIDEEVFQNKVQLAQATSGVLSGLTDLVGRDTAAGKALAIAQATIDTFTSASTIFRQAAKNPITVVNPAYPYLLAAPAVLSGIARVKQIASVKVPGGSASSNAPNIQAQAPIAPSIPLINTRTQLDSTSIQQLGSATNRAYVLESDVTNSQERIRRINRAARLA